MGSVDQVPRSTASCPARRPSPRPSPSAGTRRGRRRRRPSCGLPRDSGVVLPLLGELLGGDQRRAEHARARAVARDPDRRCSGPDPARRGGTPRSRAGSSSRSPARETPPPITTSSGSNVLIALAIPMPEPLAQHPQAPQRRRRRPPRRPRPRRGRRSRPSRARMLARGASRGYCDRGVVGQPVQRAAGGQRLQRARAAGTGRRGTLLPNSRSRPMIVCPTSAAEVVAPR